MSQTDDAAHPETFAAYFAALRRKKRQTPEWIALMAERRGVTVREESPEARAQRVPLSASTIRRWESGATVPQEATLRVALAVLGIGEGEQAKVVTLALSERRRGVQALRRPLAVGKDGAAPGKEGLPEALRAAVGTGDLLRAMRARKGLTNAELARTLGVRPYHVTRWEKSVALPPEDRMPALLAALDAHDEERAFLSRRSFLLAVAAVPALESLARGHRRGLETYAKRLDTLEEMTRRGVDFPGGLYFLALESELLPRARAKERQDARLLLARTWVARADWLERRGRPDAIVRLSESALEMMPLSGREPERVPAREWWWARAVELRAARRHAESRPGEMGDGPALNRALGMVKEWLPSFPVPAQRYRLLQQAAGYVALLSSPLEALPIGVQAMAMAERTEQPQDLLYARMAHARLLCKVDQPETALALIERTVEEVGDLEALCTLDAHVTLWLLIRRSEALCDIAAWDEARKTLAEVHALADRFDAPYLNRDTNGVESRIPAGVVPVTPRDDAGGQSVVQ